MNEKEAIEEALQNGIANVSFTKKNGEQRNLTGTKNYELIPESDHPKGSSSTNTNDDLITVYDIQNNGWRSFYVSSVISYETNVTTETQ